MRGKAGEVGGGHIVKALNSGVKEGQRLTQFKYKEPMKHFEQEAIRLEF